MGGLCAGHPVPGPVATLWFLMETGCAGCIFTKWHRFAAIGTGSNFIAMSQSLFEGRYHQKPQIAKEVSEVLRVCRQNNVEAWCIQGWLREDRNYANVEQKWGGVGYRPQLIKNEKPTLHFEHNNEAMR